MAEPLWTPDALVGATGGQLDGPPVRPVGGVSIDTRTLQPGDLFVALTAERDGHDFVGNAFEAGAAAALVKTDFVPPRGGGARALLRVDDPLRALERLGIAARKRTAARVLAVTGSVGKTGTKEALHLCLSALGATHASEKSYNNHWGVPLTLARMPAPAAFAVLEIGMNRAGEITPLSCMVRPQIAIITTVGPVHIAFFPSEEAIADAKAEIFAGLEKGGTAILNRDNRHFERLASQARAAGAGRIIAFGRAAEADARLRDVAPSAEGSTVRAVIDGRAVTYVIGAPGDHYVLNSLAVLSAVAAVDGDLVRAAAELAKVRAPVGRGARQEIPIRGGKVLLIDESYNANPFSVRAALSVMGETPRSDFPRRIVVLGDMRELGEQSDALHAALRDPVVASGADLVLACGQHMAMLYDELPAAIRGGYAATAEELRESVIKTVQPGDAVMIKGSLGSRMGPLVTALKEHLARLEG
jgi:UDP-N-acetylmuramoyl-tripeptide--D-alanyl-D-alanine ligase